MAASTLAPSNPSLHHTLTLEDSPAPPPREASFSSYLSTAEESFSLRLSCEFTDGNATSVQTSLRSGGKKNFEAQEGELDVFGAEKYFSVGMDGDEVVVVEPEKPRKPSPAVEAKFACRKPRPGTPNTCSEANCRSRSALLRDAQKGPAAPTSQKPAARSAGSKGLFRVFGCSCSSEASVEVRKVSKGAGGPNAAGQRGGPGQVRPELWCSEESKREDCFAFRPALYPLVAGNLAVADKGLGEKKKAQLPSTAAHGPPFMEEGLGSGLRRSLAMMTTPFTGGAGVAGDDDVCSESSSDLFEIDSISTSTLQFSTAGGGTSASTICSAPSEASIEWSVVTASATNFSVVSDVEPSPPEAGKAVGIWHQRSGWWSLLGYDGVGKAPAAGILSNTHELPDMVEASEWLRRRKPMAAMPVISYQPECSRPVDFKQGKGARGSVEHGIQRSIPPHKPYLW